MKRHQVHQSSASSPTRPLHASGDSNNNLLSSSSSSAAIINNTNEGHGHTDDVHHAIEEGYFENKKDLPPVDGSSGLPSHPSPSHFPSSSKESPLWRVVMYILIAIALWAFYHVIVHIAMNPQSALWRSASSANLEEILPHSGTPSFLQNINLLQPHHSTSTEMKEDPEAQFLHDYTLQDSAQDHKNPHFNKHFQQNQWIQNDQYLRKSDPKKSKTITPRKQRIAYLFAGSIRSFLCPKVHWSIRMNVIDALGGEAFTFFHITTEDNFNIKTGDGVILKHAYPSQTLNETLSILNPRVIEYFTLSTQEEDMAKQYPGFHHQTFRLFDNRRYSMFYHRCQSYQLMQRYERDVLKGKFDWVVLIRLDAAWLHPLQPIAQYDNRYVHITETGYVPFNDQFMLIPRKHSDYLYDLNTKIAENVYCLGGPDVETWKCNVTSLHRFYTDHRDKRGANNSPQNPDAQPKRIIEGLEDIPSLVTHTLTRCCSDVHDRNVLGYSETVHYRHLLEGKIPVAMARFPVYLVRYVGANHGIDLALDKQRDEDLLKTNFTDALRGSFGYNHVGGTHVLQSKHRINTNQVPALDSRRMVVFDDNDACVPECGRLNHNFKDFHMEVLTKKYPYMSPFSSLAENTQHTASSESPTEAEGGKVVKKKYLTDTRATLLNSADPGRCELYNHPTLLPYQPISAERYHRLIPATPNTEGSVEGTANHHWKRVDYTSNLYAQLDQLPVNLRLNWYQYQSWRIHPTKNTDGCLTAALTPYYPFNAEKNAKVSYSEIEIQPVVPFGQQDWLREVSKLLLTNNEEHKENIKFYPLFWQRCIDHGRVKGGKRYHPQQMFYLNVLPLHNADLKMFTHPAIHDVVENYLFDGIKQTTEEEGGAYSAKMLAFYKQQMSNYTRIIYPQSESTNVDMLGGKDRHSFYYNTYIRPEEKEKRTVPNAFDKYDVQSPVKDFPRFASNTFYCFTVMNERSYDVLLQPCDLTGVDRRQWFLTVKGETPGAHGYLSTTIGTVHYVGRPDYCLIRDAPVNYERTELIMTSLLKLIPCKDVIATSKKFFEFEHIPLYY